MMAKRTAKPTHARSALLTAEATGRFEFDRALVESPLLSRLLVRFVYLSEAHGASKSTSGFIRDLRIDRTERASRLLHRLGSDLGVDVRSYSNPDDLGKALSRDGLATGEFIHCDREFAYYVFSGHAAIAKRVKELSEFKVGAKRKTGSKRQNKSEFYRLDSLFRHLRNSLAHGQFVRVKTNGKWYWAFQDSNVKGVVTSRWLLSEASLKKWLSIINSRDRRMK